MYKAIVCRLFGHRRVERIVGAWEDNDTRSIFDRCVFCKTVLQAEVEQHPDAIVRAQRDAHIRSRCLG